MHIILEGIDASGKSTLAKHLANALVCTIQDSEGPEKEPGEIITRIMKYDRLMSQERIIFDRHPVFSHPIYSQGSKWMTRIPPAITQDLLTRPILIVYCRPMTEGFDNHVENEGGEDPEHLKKVSANYTQWLADYDAWAVRHAHMIYNCGQQFDETAQRILKVVR